MSVPPRYVDNPPALLIDPKSVEVMKDGTLRVVLSDEDIAWLLQSLSPIAARRLRVRWDAWSAGRE